jgi:hypothetical protein
MAGILFVVQFLGSLASLWCTGFALTLIIVLVVNRLHPEDDKELPIIVDWLDLLTIFIFWPKLFYGFITGKSLTKDQ